MTDSDERRRMIASLTQHYKAKPLDATDDKEATDERQKWKQSRFAEHYGMSLDTYREVYGDYQRSVSDAIAFLKQRYGISTKENKEMTEEKQPVFDSVGVEVRGDVKEMYTIKGTSKTHGGQGEFWFTTRTSCGRDVVSILHPSGTYEVAIFLNGELERGYRGKEGSDAHRVYDGSLRVWAMKEARGELGTKVVQAEDMEFIELVVPEGEHCLPPEAVPRPPTVRLVVGVDFAAEEQAARRAHPEYQQMLSNLTSTQERCTKQEQEIRDLREKVRNLCHEITDVETAHATELEEMRDRYEAARDRADRLQDELLEKESE